MMFEKIEVGDEVSVWHTDKNRQYRDMTHYVGRSKVLRVTDGTLTVQQGTFLRRNGVHRLRSQWSVRPADDARDENSLRIQAEEKERQAKAREMKNRGIMP